MKYKPTYYKFVVTSLFVAILFILAFTPFGYIHLGVIKATVIHIPVILGSILLGPKIGAMLGGLFGLTSLASNTLTPSLLSFAFSPLIPLPGTDEGSMYALLVCFVPRLLVGIVPFFVFRLCHYVLRRQNKNEAISLGVAAVVGSMTNTLLVLHLMYFVFQDFYARAMNIPLDAVYEAIMVTVAINGIPEAIVAAIVVVPLGKVLLRQMKDM